MNQTPDQPRRDKSGRYAPKDGARIMQRLFDENRLDGRTRWVKRWRSLCDTYVQYFNAQDDIAMQTVIDRLAFRVLIVMSQEGRVFKDGGPILEGGELHPALRKNGYNSYANAIERCIAQLEEMSANRKGDDVPSLGDYLAEKRTATNANGNAQPEPAGG